MLYEFLTNQREELIARCQAKVEQRVSPAVPAEELQHGISLFLDQLTRTLEIETQSDPQRSLHVSGPSGGGNGAVSEIGDEAALHGRELLDLGFTIEQVVHSYGDLCQAIADVAVERGIPFSADEYRTLNRCLDNATASAVTEFTHLQRVDTRDRWDQEVNERLGTLAHEMRNYLSTATIALTVIRTGNVGLTGATGAVLDRSLLGIGNLIDRSLAEVRMTAKMPLQLQLFSLAVFIAEAKVSATMEARDRDCTLRVFEVDTQLAVEADRDLLFSALNNLLQNAFKFTHRHSEVTLRAHAVGERILMEVEDHCGGLPPGFVDTMFQPFTQGSEDKSGLGLGLSIVKRSVEANKGILCVRDIPGSGCVFTIDLPRHTMARSPNEGH